MKFPLENVLLSADDGLVQSSNKIWYHFDKYQWNLFGKKNNLFDSEHKGHIQSRLEKGLCDPSKASQLKGTYHLGISPHIYSYYHLITDLLPHLINFPKYPVLVAKFTPISYINFLKEIGFEIKVLPPKVFLIEKLFIPEIGPIDWNKKKLKKIQNFFEKNISRNNSSDIKYKKNHQKIYVSRKLVSKRHLRNEDEFLPILKKFNFKKVFLEKMSIQDQVTLFRNITHIIAPHGAGLTNVLFASSEIKILEIRPVLSSGKFCFENLFSLGWPNYEIIVPPQTGKFFLPVKELERILFRWKNDLNVI